MICVQCTLANMLNYVLITEELRNLFLNRKIHLTSIRIERVEDVIVV